MPYALHAIMPPGGLVAGYQRGHEILPSVIESWGLVEGQDWSAEHPDHAEQMLVAAAPRPVDDGDRAAWVAYVISRGTPAIDAEGMDLPVLMDLYPEEDESATDDADRPADSAKKAEWVRYVSSHSQADDETKAWAADDSTTKAELQAWQPSEPTVGDPLATSATERANG